MIRLDRLPLRLRLVAGFSLAMMVVLAAAGAFVFWRVEYALDRALDAELSQATDALSEQVDPAGEILADTSLSLPGITWQVLDAAGRVTDSGGVTDERALVPGSALAGADDAARDGEPVRRDVGAFLLPSAQPLRLQVTPAGTAHYLVVGVRRDLRDEALRELLLQLALSGLGALVVTALVGERLALAALHPVERYRRRAQAIAAGATGLRLDVPDGRDDEVTRLGHTLNDMLAELERALEHERRFVDEASHELRTPLTLLTSRIQLARRRPRTVAEHQQVLAELEVDVASLTRLARQLLAEGAAADSGGSCDLTEQVATLLQRRTEAELDLTDDVTLDGPQAPVPVGLTGSAVERVVGNLIDNARSHGRVPVRLVVDTVPAAVTAAGAGWARLRLTDAGDGMDAPLLAVATTRFARAESSRGRPGAGLGLSLVRDVVERAGGELRLCARGAHISHGPPTPVPCEHDAAMTVTLLLPLADAGPTG